MSSYRNLLPLSTLIGFESAARLQSFSRAARELNLTQSAISHQIRQLENQLGQPLFRRIGRRIELVDAGRDFLTTVQAALEELRHGVRRLNAYSKPGSVIVMMPAALATGWFIPRLSRLRETHPHIEPWIHTAETSHVPEEAEIDIVLGPGPWADGGAQSVILAEDRLFPLSSPGFARELPDVPCASRLDTAPLLHDETSNDWQLWFAQVNSSRKEFSRGTNFSDSGQMLQAAMLGLGVCLASERHAERALAEGTLVLASPTPLERTERLCMSVWKRNLSRKPVLELWDWIARECGAGRSY